MRFGPTHARNFRGIEVLVDYDVPTERGSAALVTLPDRSTLLVPMAHDRKSLDESLCYHVWNWGVDQWAASGHGGAL